MSDSQYLGKRHPLAEVARRMCRTARHSKNSVACGRCWETAIRADERAVVLFDLPAEPPAPDVSYVDWVAVERACGGELLRLTAAERAEVARRTVAGRVQWRHTHMSGTTVVQRASAVAYRAIAAERPGEPDARPAA